MKSFACLLFALLLSVVTIFTAEAQKNKKGRQNAKNTPAVTVPKKTVRGAATTAELGQYVYAALQENNFDAITQYFPSENDINATGAKTPDEDLQQVLQDQTPATIQAAFQADFEELQNKAIDQGISFRDLGLMEVQPGAPQKANRLLPVNLLLTNPNNQTLTITFEKLKINGRFFLFQHIGIQPKQ